MERQRFDARRILITHLGREVLENPERVEFDTAHDGMRLQI